MTHDGKNVDGREKQEAVDAESAVKPSGGGNGLSTGLQPSGTIPGGSPGAGVGSIGTGGGSTGGASTGNAGSGG